uniref:Uncharacterized protein n=1 Tax=Manihot esculenta TaxID=3983 RepID=A0A199U912_MANES
MGNWQFSIEFLFYYNQLLHSTNCWLKLDFFVREKSSSNFDKIHSCCFKANSKVSVRDWQSSEDEQEIAAMTVCWGLVVSRVRYLLVFLFLMPLVVVSRSLTW